MFGKVSVRRFAAIGAVAGGVGLAVAAPASASTIPKEHVQLCAQGDYPAFIQFPDRGGLTSTVVNPGTCWYEDMGSLGYYEPIYVFAFNSSDVWVKLGAVGYNGNVSGVGIGTEGHSNAPGFISW
jgi:hypothetical protein